MNKIIWRIVSQKDNIITFILAMIITAILVAVVNLLGINVTI